MLAEWFRSGDGSVRKKLAKAEVTLEKRVEEVRTVLVKSRAAGTDAKTRRRAMNGVLKSALPRLKAQTRKEQAALRSASRAAIRDAKRAAARTRAEEEKTARRIEQEEKAFRAALRKTANARAKNTRKRTSR